MAAPKRKRPTDKVAEALKRRDGMNCFLCGAPHANLRTMSVGYVTPSKKTPETAFLACTTCIRRRDGKPLTAYLQERAKAASAELDHIYNFLRPSSKYSKIREMLMAPIYMGTEEEPEEENPNLGQRIQDVPWRELLKMQIPELDGLIKEPQSDREAWLIDALYKRRELAGQGPQGYDAVTVMKDFDKNLWLMWLESGDKEPCQWEGQSQHRAKK